MDRTNGLPNDPAFDEFEQTSGFLVIQSLSFHHDIWVVQQLCSSFMNDDFYGASNTLNILILAGTMECRSSFELRKSDVRGPLRKWEKENLGLQGMGSQSG